MKKSRYFAELFNSYSDEIDDLLSDSEGKTVLQKRLNDKRRAVEAILPMIDFSPEMVAVMFYGAFGFKSVELMQRTVLAEPGRAGFPKWEEVKPALTIASWAEALIVATLKVRGGDVFLVKTAALEFLRSKDSGPAASDTQERQERGREREANRDDDDEGEEDLAEAGADWLAEQGFDTLDR